MEKRCAVCGESSTRQLGLCPKCCRPRHAKCSGNKKGAPCDLCRREEQLSTSTKASNFTMPKSAQVSTRASLSRRTLNSSVIIAPHQRAPLSLSTPVTKLSSRNSSACASRSQLAASAESAGRAAGAQGPGEPERVEQVNCSQAPKSQLCDSAGRVTVAQAPTCEDPEEDARSVTASTPTARTPGTIQVLPPPLRDVNLDGVNNVLIPVSTLEFFFQRFDMLEKQLDEIRSLGGRSPAICSTNAHVVAQNTSNVQLSTRVSALEELITNQNKSLEDLNTKSQLLLEDNLIVKDKLDKALSGFKCLQRADGDINIKDTVINPPVSRTDDSTPMIRCNEQHQSSRPGLAVAGADTGAGSSEPCEIIINGVLNTDSDIPNETASTVAFAVLRTILPSFERGNILEARVMRARDSSQRSERETGWASGLRSNVQRSCIVRLSSAGLAREVMRAKRALANNYLTTSDINPQLLEPVSAACMPSHKVFINEMLPHEKFQLFKGLKSIAQGLGFKYVWHSGGRFLTRRRGGERAHVFATAADLQAIRMACQSAPKQHLPNSTSPSQVIDNSERQGAELVVESAQLP